jgi:rhodanese-related sulfurtransferase
VSESAIDQLLARARGTLPARPTAADLPGLRARGALIVDTRPVGLRQRDGEMDGAVVVDRNQLEWRLDPTSPYRIPEVTGPDQEIVVVCDEGYASSLAAATLQWLGLHRATDLDGGFQAVRALARARALAGARDRDGVGVVEG